LTQGACLAPIIRHTPFKPESGDGPSGSICAAVEAASAMAKMAFV
jgi:hypothetical protein